jgi:two-component system, OmpR family, sensor histidine kinase ChvG
MRRARSLVWSPIARLILASNLAGLVILIAGALVLNEVRSNLVEARKESLNETADIIASFLTEAAAEGVPGPRLNPDIARFQLKRMALSGDSRMRVHDADGKVVADTLLLRDRIAGQPLPPLRDPSAWDAAWLNIVRGVNAFVESLRSGSGEAITATRSIGEEVATALSGDTAASERFNENAERVISVTVPIRVVGAVVGTLSLETSDVAEIIAAERMALLPFIVVAVLVAIITSALLTAGIARPMRRLALASDRVRTGAAERLNLGGLHDRKDEIGDLARALEGMTNALYDRIQSNERFAADVAHELKNPLTSIRSAVDTARSVSKDEVRARMLEVIARDVFRLDRLITDISNLSRIEGEIMREPPMRVDLSRLLEDIVSIYRDTSRETDAVVTLNQSLLTGRVEVIGREGPIGQVMRNLVENARSFSPPGGEVRVSVQRRPSQDGPSVRIMVEDQGPGVPPDKLEKIFERFYTDRPQGAKFGNNSGLGLSIVRQIVETHRGTVWVENAVADGRITGARFIVDLPEAPGAV